MSCGVYATSTMKTLDCAEYLRQTVLIRTTAQRAQHNTIQAPLMFSLYTDSNNINDRKLSVKAVSYIQGCHSPVMIKFPDFSLTFPDILMEHLLIIDPLNSSDINKCTHFSLPHSYILITDISMTTTLSNILQLDNIGLYRKV